MTRIKQKVLKMESEDKDTTISDIHRIREQVAAKFGGDVHAINADARERMEKSGRTIIRRERHAENQEAKIKSTTTRP